MRFLTLCLLLVPSVGLADVVTFNSFTTSTPFPVAFNAFTLEGSRSVEPLPLKDIAFPTPYAFFQLSNTLSASLVFTQDISYWGADLDVGTRNACVLSKRLFLASAHSWLNDGVNAYATLSIDDPLTPQTIDREVRLSIMEGPPAFYEYDAGKSFIRSIRFTSADPDMCQPVGMDNVVAVPEPSMFVLFAGLFIGGVVLMRRKK